MAAPIELAAKAEDIWEEIVSMTKDSDERVFIAGFISGRSWAEGEQEAKELKHD